ncbi:MAG: fatty acid-binding protein DegV, partial [Peptococcaceae bacterium]|nr:fatty acid-binding protein DegV [Peptococcaceae bacterium]
GYAGGKVLIHNCQNEAAANSLKEQLLAMYPGANIRIGKTRGLCSFYAEKGGLMVGFEDGQA